MAKKKTDNKSKGAPTKYKEEYNDQAHKLCLLGYSNKELGAFFKVSESTIENWLKVHSDFLGAVTQGKDLADADVAQSFHKRAKGYDYVETKEKQGDNGCETTITNKHVPPDAGAAMNWLSNRQKKKWRKDPKVKVEVKVNDISDDELQKKIDKLEGKA
jgi:hypothetical protein